MIFLSKVADAFDEGDADEFTELVFQYDRVCSSPGQCHVLCTLHSAMLHSEYRNCDCCCAQLSPFKGWQLTVLVACKKYLLDPDETPPDLA